MGQKSEPWNCLAVTWKLLLLAGRSLEALLVVLPTWHPPSLETLPVRAHLGPPVQRARHHAARVQPHGGLKWETYYKRREHIVLSLNTNKGVQMF